MNLKKTLEQLGLVENVDFVLTESGFDMMEKTRSVVVDTIHHPLVPAQLGDNDEVIVPEIAAYDELVYGDETYTPANPTEEMLEQAWEDVQLSEADMAMLVNEFLKGKDNLRDIENDSLNIVDGLIFSWHFANIPQPTRAELLALIPVVAAHKAAADAVKAAATVGAQIRSVCDTCYNVIVGFNVTRQLTVEQVTQLSVAFADIQNDLQNLRPWSAKPKIAAVAVDGVLITQAMKDMVLSLLSAF